MELEVPRSLYFQACTIHCYGPTGFAVRQAKEVLLLQKSRDHVIDMPSIHIYSLLKIIVIKIREGRRRDEGMTFEK